MSKRDRGDAPDGGASKKPRTDKRQRGAAGAEAEPGMQVVVITCSRGQERRAANEVLALLSEKAASSKTGISEAEDEKDVEDAFAVELADLKDGGRGADGALRPLNIGISSCALIQVPRNLDAVELVNAIMDDVYGNQRMRTRYACRLHPLTELCAARAEDLGSLAYRVLSESLKPLLEKDQSSTFGIVARLRCCALERLAAIQAVAGAVERLADECSHKVSVNLDAPKFTILVDGFKTLCGVSLVPRYLEYRRYALQLSGE